jgi:hypothetical protein
VVGTPCSDFKRVPIRCSLKILFVKNTQLPVFEFRRRIAVTVFFVTCKLYRAKRKVPDSFSLPWGKKER